jgi:hypothetical protein
MGTGVLPVRGALRLVELALIDTISIALRKRGPVAATETALAALPTLGPSSTGSLIDGEPRYVTGTGLCFQWREFSTATPAAGSVVRPTDRSSKPGRWLVSASTIVGPDGTELRSATAGYLKAVVPYQGERNEEEWDARIWGRRPAVLIQYAGESSEQVSNLRGAIKEKYYRFAIWGVSFNARPSTEALIGSSVAAEASADPGVITILSDLEDLLDGLTGAEMGVDGIDHLRLGDVEPMIEDLAHRQFVWSVPLDVRCTVGKEDRPSRVLIDLAYAQGQHPPGTDYGPDYLLFSQTQPFQFDGPDDTGFDAGGFAG